MFAVSKKLSARAIQSTPGVCGGNARIRNSRIPVWTLVSLHQQGADQAELLRNYPGLSDRHLENAWRYYATAKKSIALLFPIKLNSRIVDR